MKKFSLLFKRRKLRTRYGRERESTHEILILLPCSARAWAACPISGKQKKSYGTPISAIVPSTVLFFLFLPFLSFSTICKRATRTFCRWHFGVAALEITITTSSVLFGIFGYKRLYQIQIKYKMHPRVEFIYYLFYFNRHSNGRRRFCFKNSSMVFWSDRYWGRDSCCLHRSLSLFFPVTELPISTRPAA